MKRLEVISLLVIVIMVLFTGCTKDDSIGNSSGEITGSLTIITQRTDLLLESAPISMYDYAEEFNKIYPDVTIEFEGITDYEGQIRIRMNTDEYGDVLMIPRENFTKDQLPNFFEPLGNAQEMKDKYLWIEDSAYDNVAYGLASVGNAQGIIYNKDVFAAAGISELPSTPNEFIEALAAIKEKTDAIPYYTNYAAGWPMGGQWEVQGPSIAGDPDWERSLPFTDEPWSEGEPYYVLAKLLNDMVRMDLIEEDPSTTDWEGCKGMIARGDIATMVLGSWAIVQMQEAAVNESLDPAVIGYMPFPYTNKDGNIYAASGGDYNLGINIHSNNKTAAKAWVDWFVNDSGFTIDQGGISPVIGSDMPASLQGFQDLGVIFITNSPAEAGYETYLDDVDSEAEIGRWSESYRMRILEAGIGNRDESFEDIMKDLNSRWSSARTELGIE